MRFVPKVGTLSLPSPCPLSISWSATLRCPTFTAPGAEPVFVGRLANPPASIKLTTTSKTRFSPMPKTRPYLFYDVALSICSTCYRKVEAKTVFQDDNVYLLKRCPQHGPERVLIADDIDYYRRCREVFIKPPEMPQVYNTPVKWGCPYDCGLCTDHEQHSCLTLVEICDYCNLRCPVCYADSGPDRQQFRSLPQIERMLDAVVRNEGHPDVVQLSGGEPTMHPDFFTIVEMAKARP